jgi:4-hydroxybenzoate polyprenyltransferase
MPKKSRKNGENQSLAARLLAGPAAYFQLARLGQPVGIVLLVLPALFALALVAPPGKGPDLELCILFALGAVLMRAAGCAVNDIFDKEYDAKVERTRHRPVASGAIPVWAAWLFAAILAAAAYYIASEMGDYTRYLSLASLPLIIAYPFMKRITWWPQAWLALTFNWGALLGFTAMAIRIPRGDIAGDILKGHPPVVMEGSLWPVALLLYAACFFWTLGYDTIYAFQDVEDDKKAGIKSTARLLGPIKARKWVGIWYGAFFVLMLCAGLIAHMGFAFYAGMGLALYHINLQLEFWQPEDAKNSGAIFRANMTLGVLIFLSLVAGRMLP